MTEKMRPTWTSFRRPASFDYPTESQHSTEFYTLNFWLFAIFDGVSLDEMMILARKILREYLIFDLYIVFYVIVTCEFNVDEV
jgi:hypothetical protein